MFARTDALTLHRSFTADRALARSLRAWIEEALAAFGTLAAAEVATLVDSVIGILQLLQSDESALAVELVMASETIEVRLGASGASHLVLYRRPAVQAVAATA